MLIVAASGATFAASEQTELLSEHVTPVAPQPGFFTYLGSPRALSRTGRYAVFSSSRLGLVPGQDNAERNGIFVRDRQSDTTTQLYVNQRPVDGTTPSISADGRLVAFVAYPVSLGLGGSFPFTEQVFVLDRETGALDLITGAVGGGRGNDGSSGPMISGDGHYVAFSSRASNLVAGDTNDSSDIFLTDRRTHATRRVNVSTSGKQADLDSFRPYVSNDGRYVAYWSLATNLVLNHNMDGGVYLYDRVTQKTELESVNSRGEPSDLPADSGGVSDDGRYVAFVSQARNILPPGSNPLIHAEVYVRDRTTGRVICASVSSTGEIGNDSSFYPTIAAGRYVVFESIASNLVRNDTNAQGDPSLFAGGDTFVHDLKNGATWRASVASDGTQGIAPAFYVPPAISADGKVVAFVSSAPNLVPEDTDTIADAFSHENTGRTAIRINAGGAAFTDHLGREWQADGGSASGVTKRWSKTVAGTADSGLYQDERTGPSLFYLLQVPRDGQYLVRLHFAENYEPFFHAGKRVFAVSVNGIYASTLLDVYAEAGPRTALIKEVTVQAFSNVGIHIAFSPFVDNPMIDAIEIIEQ
jgi:Tol biopolymer transport system component